MKPLFQQIVERLLSQIGEGHFKPGERLPSEHELARQYNVSRITAKKALDELAVKGMVERIRGKGTFALAAGMKDTHNTHSNPLVALLIPDFSETFGTKLLYAIEERCQRYGAHLIVKRTFGSAERETSAIKALIKLNVQGVIVFPVHGEHYNPDVLKLVLDGFPIVLVDRYLRGIPVSAVFTDNKAAGASLVSHMLGEGYKRIAFASPPAEHTSTIEDRLLGFETGLAHRSLSSAGHLVLYSSLPTSFTLPNIEADEALILSFLQKHEGIDAFIASEYNLAVVLAHALLAAGKRIPEDVAIACFDAPYDLLQEPLFTHIRQDETGMGVASVDILTKQLSGEGSVVEKALDFDLIEGRSTKRLLASNVTHNDITILQASLSATTN